MCTCINLFELLISASQSHSPNVHLMTNDMHAFVTTFILYISRSNGQFVDAACSNLMSSCTYLSDSYKSTTLHLPSGQGPRGANFTFALEGLSHIALHHSVSC